ncbi:hypothetical protein GCM10027034_34490 [Ramlibacter solisilvae]|nr:DUF4124 domain-containing protein [Ramlibacter tataouinensis]
MDVRRCLIRFTIAGTAAVVAQAATAQGSIFSCVDAKGRRLTSDRPIAECNDREQQELSPGGRVVRKLGPSLSADERAAEDEKARKAAEERNRQAEEKKRARALLARYPDPAAHDRERSAQLATVDTVIATANRRVADLGVERRKLDTELEFFKGDVSRAPPKFKRQVEDLEQQLAAQKRFIVNQEGEKQRINARFDEERGRLKEPWAQHKADAAASAAR